MVYVPYGIMVFFIFETKSKLLLMNIIYLDY